MWIRTARAFRSVGLVAGTVLLSACSGQRTVSVPTPSDDDVMIAYDRVDEDDVTGSISSLTAEELQDLRVSRVEELIRDRLPGVQVTRLPSGDYSFRIRGARSLMGSNEPLLVIDGVPVNASVMQAALANLAPQQIARIDVLKDAGSTAAYGARGSNGVILITTRSFARY